MFKKILIFLLAVFVLIQFFRPSANKSSAGQPNYIGNAHVVPGDVKPILEKACNDCHSNNTRYPWYSKIQPIAWWLDDHIRDGKKHLNFDEYSNRSLRYQYHKMEETVEMVEEGHMPLKSYTWIHKDAILSEVEKNKLLGWAEGVKKAMEAKYPLDSLVRKG